MKAIIWLQDLQQNQYHSAGAKASNLAKLQAHSLPIPRGFCIPVEVYHAHLKRHLGEKMAELIAAGDFEALREEVLGCPFTDSFAEELHQALQKLGSEGVAALAVRSSATTEDLPGSSFAGLYKTTLGITTMRQLEDSIRECWASYWSDAAVSYRMHHSMVSMHDGMGVLVQNAIQPKISGVLFTKNPLAAEKPAMVLEWIPGWGEGLMEGRQKAQRLEIDSQTGKIIHKSEEKPTEELLQALGGIIQLGKDIEGYMGNGQDIEWLLDNQGKIWVIQARPITNKRGGKTRRQWQLAYDEPFSTLGVQIAFKRYFVWVKVINRLYKTRFKPAVVVVGGQLYYQSPWREPPAAIRLWMGLWKTVMWVFAPRILKKYQISLQQLLPRGSISAGEPEPRELKPKQLIADLLRAIADYLQLQYDSYPTIEAAKAATAILDRLCRMWLREVNLGAVDFLAGLSNLTLERDIALERLAGAYRKESHTSRLQPKNGDDFLKYLESGMFGADFKQAFESFHNEYGYIWADRYPRDPAWEVNPAAVLASLEENKQNKEEKSLEEHHQMVKSTRKANKHTAEQAIKASRWGKIKWTLFRCALRRAEQTYPYKEDRNQHVYTAVARIRHLARELGKHMVASGWLPQASDIFYLSLEELEKLGEAGIGRSIDLKAIHQRKQAYLRLKMRASSPEKRTSDGTAHQKPKGAKATMRGEPCSPGEACGAARLVRSLADLSSLKRGEILVCRQMRPAWSTAFQRAAGVLVEEGSLLSHGATLAREYGIPAVMNLPDLLTSIHSGDQVALDGTKGEIWIDQNEQMIDDFNIPT